MVYFELLSGRRGSNPPPIAWKAIALPNELLPLHGLFQKSFDLQTSSLTSDEMLYRWATTASSFLYSFSSAYLKNLIILYSLVGRSGFEPLKSKDSGFTVRPIWPLWNLPGNVLWENLPFASQQRDSNPRPADYKSAALANWAMLAIPYIRLYWLPA